MVGVGVGLALGVGLGTGLGAGLNAAGTLGITYTHAPRARSAVSAREWFRSCSMTEAEANPIPTSEELELLLARMQARYAEPRWGTP
jgi:hypothetical protein